MVVVVVGLRCGGPVRAVYNEAGGGEAAGAAGADGEVRGRSAEGRRRRAEVRGQRSEVRGRRAEVRGQGSDRGAASGPHLNMRHLLPLTSSRAPTNQLYFGIHDFRHDYGGTYGKSCQSLAGVSLTLFSWNIKCSICSRPFIGCLRRRYSTARQPSSRLILGRQKIDMLVRFYRPASRPIPRCPSAFGSVLRPRGTLGRYRDG